MTARPLHTDHRRNRISAATPASRLFITYVPISPGVASSVSLTIDIQAGMSISRFRASAALTATSLCDRAHTMINCVAESSLRIIRFANELGLIARLLWGRGDPGAVIAS